MRSKLQAIAQTFVKQVGEDLSRYTFVFPNHRAGVFFRKYLSQSVDRPMFAPRVMSINECFAELSDLQVSDQLTLLLHLYSIYQDIRPNAEELERFIYWGKMMLADFSEIDNHLISHVDTLFASVIDLHNIDEHYAYLSDNQRRALTHFWGEYIDSDKHHPNGELHQRFLHTWDLLYPLYTTLRERLKQRGLAYEGMLHREVIEKWKDIPLERFREQYVFLGFNALTASETQLMLRLQEMGKADFYFDYDGPFLSDLQNKASMFMEENLRQFRSRYDVSEPASSSDLPGELDITLISVSSTVGEAHEVHRILSAMDNSKGNELVRTAVVLPDEQLLIPLLNAFPENISKINVTMGYPLRAMSLYAIVAYPDKTLVPMPETASLFIEQMRSVLLTKRNDENAEGVYQLCKVLDRLEVALTTFTNIAFTVKDIEQLFKMLTQELAIPYAGEPLDGLQVMGVLETRALDFDTIIITGFNDDLYPGHARSNSFIPYALRHGFGLPTPERQDAIFAYNFYRMLSHAQKVWLITNSTTDYQHSGEVSRYLQQLRLQYGLEIKEKLIANQLVASANTECRVVEKDSRVQQLSTLSASALKIYLRCQKRFYYKYIEHYEEPNLDDDVIVSEATLGNVLHAVMQHLYEPYVGRMVAASDVEKLLEYVNDDIHWFALPALADLGGDQLAARVVQTYVNKVLTYDYKQAPFEYIASESHYKRQFKTATKEFMLHGFVDRIDRKVDMVRVVDYKTGGAELVFSTMAEVFGRSKTNEDVGFEIRGEGKKDVLQTLFYCWLLNDKYDQLAPYLYAVRKMTDCDAKTFVYRKKTDEPLVWNEEVQQKFENELYALLDEIFNLELPYHPAKDKKTCDNCAFVQICNT